MTITPHPRVVPDRAAPRGIPLPRLAGVLVLVVGTATAVTGTFLPWLSSGRVTRNSYQVAGTVDRFRVIDSALLDAAVTVWPFVGPALLVPVLLVAVRRWRTAASVAILIGGVCAAGAVTAQVIVGDRGTMGVSLDPLGPSIVTIGGVLLVLAAVLLWLPTVRAVRLSFGRSTERPNGT